MSSDRHRSERGIVSAWQIATIGLSVLFVATGSFAIWAFVNYNDASSDLQGKIDVAIAKAKEDKGNEDEQKFEERDKQPYTKFTGPSDYCSLTFQYPKTWSVYESEQISNGSDYKAYFYPVVVPVITTSQQYALRVVIEHRNYDEVLNNYQSLIQKGDLKQSSTTSNGQRGTRLTGDFSKDIRGDAVIYSCNDKTISIFTDATTFRPDFESVIRTVDFTL